MKLNSLFLPTGISFSKTAKSFFVFLFVNSFFLQVAFADYLSAFYGPGNHSNYDIVYHRISITVNPGTSSAISNGSVTTYFKTTVNNVTSLEFDLDGAMTVSSATYHGSSITKSHNTTTDVLTLTIPNIAVTGTLDSVTINYSGTPLAAGSPVPSGVNRKTTPTTVLFTLGEPYSGYTWWPCKETLYDKIDSVDMIVTAPNTYKVAGNGLVTETPSGGNTITTWKTRYPIATYMINFSVAAYQNYQFTVPLGSVNLPVMNYLYTADNNATYQGYVDVTKNILPMFSNIFGDYPFLNEKYGLAECGNFGWGALEVQSMTFIDRGSLSNKYTIAHELAHQWFGDKLTTNSWHQIWLNEGFATFCEYIIFPENLYPAELAGKRSTLKSSVTTTSKTYVTDTSTANNIFVGSGTQPYEKGGMLLSMLRTWLGDAKFFPALKKYAQSSGSGGFTSVDTLKKYMEAAIPGEDLTNFFNDWVTKAGKVTYNVKYQYVTKGVYLQLTQSPTSAGAGYFDMPVPIRIQNSSGLDTTVVVIDKRGTLYRKPQGISYGSNVIFYPLSATPTIAPVLDPNNLVLATSSAVTSNSSLSGLVTLPLKDIAISANSLTNSTKIAWSFYSDEPITSVTIERSGDGSNFEDIYTYTNPANNSNIYSNTFIDAINEGSHFYRIKIVNNEGVVTFSKIVELKKEISSNKIQLFPNPVINELSIVLTPSLLNNSGELYIQNAYGQILIKKTITKTDYNQKITIPLKTLSSGLYSVWFINNKGEKISSNFIKTE